MLFNANKKRLATGDAFPSHSTYKADLPKGNYVLLLQVRHENMVMLEKLTSLTMLLERTLPTPVTLEIFDRPAVCGGSKMADLALSKFSSTCCYVNAPALDPTNVVTGDTLIGKLVLTETFPKNSNFAAVPIYYQAGFQTAPLKTELPAAPVPSPALLDDVIRDAQILFLPKLKVDAYLETYASYVYRSLSITLTLA